MWRPTGRDVFCSYSLYFGDNAPTSDNIQVDTLQGIQRICADCGLSLLEIAPLITVLILISACQPAVETSTSILPEVAPAAACGEQGYLSTELFGALAGRIEWASTEFECEGMPRPGGDGARLRFAGDIDGEHKIAFIIALPDLRRGETGKEFQSKVTVIEEGVGRFFTTGDNEICWTDIVELESVEESDSDSSIGGTLYCVAPLAEINGDSDITILDLKFRGQLDWDSS